MARLHRPWLPAALLLLLPLAAGAQAPLKSVRAYADQGHLFVVDVRGNVTRIAHAAHVVEAVLSPDGRRVAYVERRPPTPDDEADPDLLWLTDAQGGQARLLVDPRHTRQNPQPRGDEITREVQNNLTGVARAQFSPDGRTLFFLTFGWQTSQAVHAVDLTTGHVRFLCGGNDLDVIRAGKDRGMLRVDQHRYYDNMRGSYDQEWLVTPSGRLVRPLGPKEAPG